GPADRSRRLELAVRVAAVAVLRVAVVALLAGLEGPVAAARTVGDDDARPLAILGQRAGRRVGTRGADDLVRLVDIDVALDRAGITGGRARERRVSGARRQHLVVLGLDTGDEEDQLVGLGGGPRRTDRDGRRAARRRGGLVESTLD